MARIAGVHISAAALATVRRMLASLGDGSAAPTATGSRVVESDRATFGWIGQSAPVIAEAGSVIVAIDGQFYNRDEVDRDTGEDGAANDAARLAALFRKHGIDGALARVNGDFAAAIYDRARDTLWLARDRFGVRPLYFARRGDTFAFASQPRALFAIDGISSSVNSRFVANFAGNHYRHFDNRPSESPFQDIGQLPAASVLQWRNGTVTVRRYWDLKEQPEFDGTEAQLAAEYRDLLRDAVRRRFAVAEAPAFTLSGGLDSSSVLSCAVEAAGKTQQAFSSVYVDPTFDESAQIKSMLDSKVSHWHQVRIGTPDVLDLVGKMVASHDEPVATATWLSHFLLCDQVSRGGFKTLFGGLGGDELNAGEYEYFFYLFADLRRADAEAELDREVVEWVKHHDHPIYRKNKAVVEDSFARIADLSVPGVCRPDERRMTRYFNTVNPEFFDLAGDKHVMDHPFASYLRNRTYQDLFRETTPCCLRAEDRHSALFGLTHVDPFLDYRLAEFMFRVPGQMKIRDGITKRLLREAMRGILPEETRTRIKKTGWNAPAHEWFGSGRVGDDVRDLVASRAFRERGIYNVREVERILDDHRRIVSERLPQENHMMFLWQLVNLEQWFRVVVDRQSAMAA